MAKVTDIIEKRREARLDKLVASVDKDNMFSIPWDDVVQGLDSANDSLSDPIRLGPRAHAAFQRLVDEFCLERLPETMGEAQGLLQYCWHMAGNARFGMVTFPEDEEIWQCSVLKVAEEYTPAFVEITKAYFSKDKAEMARIHRTTLTMKELGSRVLPDGGYRFYELDK